MCTLTCRQKCKVPVFSIGEYWPISGTEFQVVTLTSLITIYSIHQYAGHPMQINIPR